MSWWKKRLIELAVVLVLGAAVVITAITSIDKQKRKAEESMPAAIEAK